MSQSNLAAEWQFYDGNGGYARYADPSGATRLTDAPTAGVALPSDATHAFIFVNDAAVRFKVDRTSTATAAEGGVLAAGHIWPIENNRGFLKGLSFINKTASAAEVIVIYAKQPDGSVLS